MEPIAQSLSTYKPESLTLARPLTLSNVSFIMDSLKGHLGTKMAEMWKGIDPSIIEREWSAGLAGLQKHELQRGIAACADRKFAPTLGEFKNLCRPAIDPEFAWHEAQECLRERDTGLRGSWTHPAVFFAACEMSTEVRTGDYARNRVRWARLLGKEFALGWRHVPDPAMRVSHDARTGPPSPEQRVKIAHLLEEAKRHREAIVAERKRADDTEGGAI